jgi:hypothetical protein
VFSTKRGNVKGRVTLQFAAQSTTWNKVVKCARNQSLGNGSANSECVLNEFALARDESTVSPNDVIDGREEPKVMQS